MYAVIILVVLAMSSLSASCLPKSTLPVFASAIAQALQVVSGGPSSDSRGLAGELLAVDLFGRELFGIVE